MTVDDGAVAGRLRLRLTAPVRPGRTSRTLPLAGDAAAGLARISGGRAVEELVVLVAAATVTLAAMDGCDEAVTLVRGPAGMLACPVALSSVETVADLVVAVDATLRAQFAGVAGSPESAGVMLVCSSRVAAGAVGPSDPALIVMLDGDPGVGRVLRADADPTRLAPWFVEVVLRSLAGVLAGFVEPHRPLAQLPLGAPEDIALSTQFGRATFDPPDRESTLLDPVATMVAAHPDRVAVQCGHSVLTYQQLWQATEQVAGALARHGVGAGERVAILTGKSPHAVPAILGTLLAGAAYVPLDLQSPPQRLAGILADSGSRVVLLDGGLADRLPAGDGAVPQIDLADLAASTEPSSENVVPPVTGADLAYLIYTSGSTGTPKGVAVGHGAIASYLRWKVTYHDLDPDTCLLQVPSLAFDSSVSDLFSVLSAGGRIVLVEPSPVQPRRIAAMVAEHRITHITLVPSLYQVLLDDLAPAGASLRVVTVAGEATPTELVARHHALLPGVRLINEYGPTENSIGSTAFDHGPDAGPGTPIGRPVSNTVISVVDRVGRALPPGFIGEIRLSGPGLADGYHASPELTAEVFVTQSGVPGERAYRSGDEGWWRPDGMLEFAGRLDDQVKLRGHRVETGEVENILSGLGGVRSAVVVVGCAGEPNAGLVAFVEGAGLDATALQRAAREGLPPSMVPGRIEILTELPRMVSGKPDRQELTARADALIADRAASVADSAPASSGADEVETAVGEAFAEVLGGPTAHGDDDFFVLGGHSLAAASVIGKLERRFGAVIDLDEFLDAATVRRIAELVRTSLRTPLTPAKAASPRRTPVTRVADEDVLGRLLRESNSGNVHTPES